MKEAEIVKKAVQELKLQGICAVWVAHKKKFYPDSDVFGIFDIVYYEKHGNQTHTGFIQVTTLSNLSHRRKKIISFFAAQNLAVPARVFVWAYDRNRSRFVKENIL